MASQGADGRGVALASPDALVDMADVLRLPDRVTSVADDDVGGFDEGPFEVLV